MKLYHTPGVSSLAAHIVAKEARIPLDLVKVDLKAHRTEQDTDYLAINPRGYVPALQLDNGEVITEGIVILQFLADQAPLSGLMPNDTMERYRAQQWLTFVATELHKQFFYARAELPEEVTKLARGKINRRLAELNTRLGQVPHVAGDRFTVADAYLFTVLSWTPRFGIELNEYPNLREFMVRVLERSAVREALKQEGLVDAFVERYR
jgi:glutathione S-transferase